MGTEFGSWIRRAADSPIQSSEANVAQLCRTLRTSTAPRSSKWRIAITR